MSAPRGARPGPGPRVAVVDNYDSFTYNLVHYVAEQGGRPTVFRNDAVGLADLAAFDLLLLSPGPGTPAEAGICVEAVRELGARLPILGVCLGHQSIATAFGGSVVRGEQVHGKASAVHHDGSGVLAGLPDPFTATRYHSLVVAPTGLPDELVVTARTADGTIMGLRHREHPVHGVQFHPESVLSPEGKQLIANFLECADD
ncbi:anthranilate synthase/aminodeoxychorismate synthase-like glutamine amidotransferase [Streptomyces sp. DSM 42143]|uniref:anthranilate synthase component II n=1 Tax=Streptomyces TaxID=1883 RepID=UPI000BDB98E8|nr:MULTISPECIES: aminodeoxychorismate/anthranilate synthase component II [unclassified Streptomyces]MDN3244637.1 aminodeoxychorismate/anthranilate synthase component II [Streptomyces sp. ZSW22]MDN3252619.1 aminodeoxychorismate/anthranilate synthase component II [Streptomyces sp. MA25(2023)]MDQ0384492.1 anthranilate synthase/aminodeoxychorismate synthase-like glutamine amidotransferase [Streptomyces sp. DSM 42143]PAK22683.1 aminodeoxychorismate/anthranilate synthase component II [Streptomyces sp